jgi:hypothetical protein
MRGSDNSLVSLVYHPCWRILSMMFALYSSIHTGFRRRGSETKATLSAQNWQGRAWLELETQDN